MFCWILEGRSSRLGDVAGGRHGRVGKEPQDVGFAVVEAFEQEAGLLLARAAGVVQGRRQPDQDAVAEGPQEFADGLGRGAGGAVPAVMTARISRGGEVALVLGVVAGVDQPAQGVGGLGRPVLIGVDLGGIVKITTEVRTAKLMHHTRNGCRSGLVGSDFDVGVLGGSEDGVVVQVVAVVHDGGAGGAQVRQHRFLEGVQVPVTQQVLGVQIGAGHQQVLVGLLPSRFRLLRTDP